MAFLEMKHITKIFPGIVANENINFSVEKGEIHALLGENGAGKSTLMNILYGLYEQTSGEIFLRGKPVSIKNPKEAIDQGIGMVHQHFMLIPALTVIENVILGTKKKKKVLDLNLAAKEVQELAKKYNMMVDPFVEVWKLSVGQQQRLEIIKALYRGTEILILDEPTAVLTPQEAEDFFQMLRTLTTRGLTVIFITHKLSEVMELCDRCTVLRRGRLETTVNIPDIKDTHELARLMVGKDADIEIAKKKSSPLGEVIIQAVDLAAMNSKGLVALKNISFTIRGGEILGIAGVDGNGQSELVECLTGLRKVQSGSVKICGTDTTNLGVRKVLKQGVSHIPEDRHKRGMCKGMSVKENLILMSYHTEPYSKHGFLNRKWIAAHSEKLCKDFNVQTASIEVMAEKLSGGNQQKFVVGREIERDPRLLIAMHPNRGLDIGATKYIKSRIIEERNKGAAVLFVSTELDEILELSDRIIVMYEGEIMGLIEGPTALKEEVGLMMAGAKRQEQ